MEVKGLGGRCWVGAEGAQEGNLRYTLYSANLAFQGLGRYS